MPYKLKTLQDIKSNFCTKTPIKAIKKYKMLCETDLQSPILLMYAENVFVMSLRDVEIRYCMCGHLRRCCDHKIALQPDSQMGFHRLHQEF